MGVYEIFLFLDGVGSLRSSDDRFMGEFYTEIVFNNYGQHINDTTNRDI